MDFKTMHLMKYCSWFIVLEFFYLVTGQQYTMSGSRTFAVLGEAFTWTCGMFIPTGEKINAIHFFRNNDLLAVVGYKDNECTTQATNVRYLYTCLSTSTYTVTIPAENMTESEQRSMWRCEYQTNCSYRSPNVTLSIRINVHNVSLIPSDKPLRIRENAQREVRCVVNSNALPAPVITWHLGSTNITSKAGTDTTSISITGIRADNTKTLQCRAANNNSEKTANTILEVEYPPNVNALSQKNIIEGRLLSVTCTAQPGNPSPTTFYWTKVDNPEFRQDGATLHIPNIQKNSFGTYRCTAENNYSNKENGTHNQTMVVNVYYSPTVNTLSQQDIIEGKLLTVTCTATPGNPSPTTFYWTMTENPGFRQDGATLELPAIKRSSSGTYRCTAKNSYINAEEGSDNQTMFVNVLYPPTVNDLSQLDIFEGKTLSVTCSVTPGNPNSTTFYWTKVNNPGFRQDGAILQLSNIQRNSSGSYRCTAENSFRNVFKGNHSQFMEVNVLYKPEILENNPTTPVNESEQVILLRQIVSNPLSNVTWYDGSELLRTQSLVMNATFIIQKATCTDTKNFTLVASNIVQTNVTALVELIVNCKPRSQKTNFTLGVTDTTGINFSTIVIAYPKPLIRVDYENGTVPDQMIKSINTNAVNNFTIHISQAVVNQSDFGVYHLKVWNLFGEITMIVNVIPQRKPTMPDNIEIVCEATRAKVQWKSSFDGGDPQLFTVFASNGQQSEKIPGRGENIIHSTFVQHLQPSTMYVFYVSAQNVHGFISSENISCTTLAAESSEKLPIIVGSAAASGLTLAVVVLVVVFLFRRYTKTENQAGKSQRFENDLVENESVDDDGLKDNILYVSADPGVNEKHEAAVYAAVNKKDPTSNNNSNVYAEVKKNGIEGVKEGAIYSDVKPKKGFFKKDGKVKKEKRQKRKQEVADVYENSDDIAMTANPDNVYSNTNHDNDSTKEQRGYKNKDGLLYVEVQFDTKAEERNPVIHGDDEKTDYATVEFPMPSSSHDRE